MTEKDLECLNSTKPWRITKNVVIISFASMVNFTAFGGAANLQSSIHSEAGLGTASLAALYTAAIFSNMFLSVGLIKWLGTKLTISIAYISYMPYIAAQMYPSFFTLIPAAILLGLGCGPLWSAKFTYISVCAEAYSKISFKPVEELLTRFFGIFFMIYEMNQVWGNLISSLVLTSGDNAAAVMSVNETLIPIICGADFLASADASEALAAEPSEKIWLLSGIYLACMAGAALITAVGLDSLNRNHYNAHESGSKLNTLELLAMTLKVMIDPMQLLLITIYLFTGMEKAFIGADFTAAFVSCAVGTGYIGFVLMVFGLFVVIGSLVMKYLAKFLRRFYLICAATFVHATLFCAILIWRPHTNEVYALYIIAALWGCCESVWDVQVTALYALLFPGREEAAFSNCQIWQSIGFILMYIISPYMITSYKIYLMFATMILGVLCYFVVEYHQSKHNKEKSKRNTCEYKSINLDELNPCENEL